MAMAMAMTMAMAMATAMTMAMTRNTTSTAADDPRNDDLLSIQKEERTRLCSGVSTIIVIAFGLCFVFDFAFKFTVLI